MPHWKFCKIDCHGCDSVWRNGPITIVWLSVSEFMNVRCLLCSDMWLPWSCQWLITIQIARHLVLIGNSLLSIFLLLSSIKAFGSWNPPRHRQRKYCMLSSHYSESANTRGQEETKSYCTTWRLKCFQATSNTRIIPTYDYMNLQITPSYVQSGKMYVHWGRDDRSGGWFDIIYILLIIK